MLTIFEVNEESFFSGLSCLKNNQPDPLMCWGRDRFLLFDWFILPGMLIMTAALCMFIGIFIQLIFEDKPVTEPL
jgi:hypothetical protein